MDQEEYIQLLGVACKHRVVELIERQFPQSSGFHIFWNGTTYALIFNSKDDYKWAKKHESVLLQQIKEFFAETDVNQQCPSYPIELSFGYGDKINLYWYIAEDILPNDPNELQTTPTRGPLEWRIAPWIAFTIGLLWILFVWINKKANVGWRDLYPGISLVAAGFVYRWVNEWLDGGHQDKPDLSKQELPPGNL